MTVPVAIPARRPVEGRGNKIGESEQTFYDWLVANGWEIAGWECEEFHLGKTNWLRPDCKLASGIFLEHTDADTAWHVWHLSVETRRKNKSKPSGKTFISPLEYLDRKRERIARAERLHGITIVLLPAMLREQIYRQPELLQKLIDLRKSSPDDYEAFLDEQLKILTP
jgi:hypothetical protein